MEETAQIKTKNGKIIEYTSIKIVKRFGNAGHIILPKELIDKKVNVSIRKKQ